MKNRWKEGKYHPTFTSSHYKEMAILGAKKRFSNYTYKPKRVKKTCEFKFITIKRDEMLKEIRRNQLSAYKKLGWIRV